MAKKKRGLVERLRRARFTSSLGGFYFDGGWFDGEDETGLLEIKVLRQFVGGHPDDIIVTIFSICIFKFSLYLGYSNM